MFKIIFTYWVAVIALSFLLVPEVSSAASKNLTCADVSAYSGDMNSGTCSGDIWTFGTPASYGWVQFSSLPFVPVYISFIYSGSNPIEIENGSFSLLNTFSSTVSDATLGGSPDSSLVLYHDTNPSRNFSGTISHLCISDTLGECAIIPPTPPEPIATSTIITNPNQDFFNGIFAFIFVMFGMVWLFGKKR